MKQSSRFFIVLALAASLLTACESTQQKIVELLVTPTSAPTSTPIAMPAPTNTHALALTPTRTATSTHTPTLTPTRIPPTPTRVPLTPTRAPLKIDLREADLKGKVKYAISGDGLESINVTLELTDEEPLEVTIEPGTVFQATSAGTQNMVVRQPKTVLLKSRGVKVTVKVEVACANMELDEPGPSDRFTIRKEPTDPDLIKLLTLPDFGKETFRVQQFAIWTITDNPSRSEYVAIGSFGRETGPTAEEFQRIRALFEKAGISLSKYRAFR